MIPTPTTLRNRSVSGCRVCDDDASIKPICQPCNDQIIAGNMGFCDQCKGFYHVPDEIHCECWEESRKRLAFIELAFHLNHPGQVIQ